MPVVWSDGEGRRAGSVDGGRRGPVRARRLSELLRPALELALAIARRDAGGSPPIEPPRRLRPFLAMRRLSTSALDDIRRAVEEEPSLLARAASAAPTEDDVGGRAPWLFLHRPGGWEDEFRSIEAAATEAADERAARRRLRSVEQELERVRAEVADARRAATSAVELEVTVVEERRRRVQVEAELAALRGRISSIERERDAAHRRASAADKALADARRATAQAAPPPAAQAEVDVEAVRSSVASAQGALVAVTEAIEAAAGVLGSARPVEEAPPRRGSGAPARRPAGRLPAPLPPGVFEDDPAAADHLLRLLSARLLVDGYNLSLGRWAGLPLAEQRTRLVDALNGLVARTGVDVEVVFDGQDDGRRGVRSTGGRRLAVRVTFSPDAVEADDVLLDLVDRAPLSRPVVVATDDRRVRREAAARGANVVGSAALFAVLGLGR